MSLKKIIPIIPIAVLICLCLVSHAQTYYPVTHLNGTQNINGINVTAIPSSSGAGSAMYCGAGPYHLGYGSNSISNPGSYTFTFSTPVANVRIRLTAMNDGEIFSFIINGIPYTLTASNLSPYGGTCSQPQAIVVGGNLATPGTPTLPGAGAEVNIGGSISSLIVATNGVQNGSVLSLFFSVIDVYSNSPVCQGDTLKLFVAPDNIPGATYSWTGPGGFSSNVPNPVIPVATMAHEGMYMATITTATTTTTDSTYVTIMPTPVTAIVYDEPVCAGKDLMLTDTTTLPGVDYQWEGPNGFGAIIPNPIIPNVQPLYSGTYILTTTLEACSYTAEALINVFQPPHYSSTEVICSNEPFDFNGRRLNEPGTYQDTLIAANGCDSTVTLNLVVLPAPEVSLSAEQQAIPLCLGDTVMFIAEGAVSYQWYCNNKFVGDGNPKYLYLPELSNKIVVIGHSDNNCSDTVTQIPHINSCCEMFIPNAFSPNGDGMNDGYGPESLAHFTDYRLSIFSRWGQMVFESFNINNKWDGRYNGIPMDIGTYFYYIRATCTGGTELIRKGDIILTR